MREDLLRLNVNEKDKEIIRLNDYLRLDESVLMLTKGFYVSDMKYSGVLCITNKRIVHVHKDPIIEKITQVMKQDITEKQIIIDETKKEITIKLVARRENPVFIISKVEDLNILKEELEKII